MSLFFEMGTFVAIFKMPKIMHISRIFWPKVMMQVSLRTISRSACLPCAIRPTLIATANWAAVRDAAALAVLAGGAVAVIAALALAYGVGTVLLGGMGN